MPAETAANTIQTAAPRTNEAGRAVPGAGQRGCIGLRRQPQNVLAHNPGGIALYAGIDNWPATQRNLARYLFLHPAAREVFSDRDNQIRGCVARLRALADAPDLTQLVGELLLKSPDFAGLWER